MEPDSKKVINVLQAGRAVAALAVIVHHAATAARDFDQPMIGIDALRTGRFGVDFFFVLSGFIIYHSTVEKGKGLRGYAAARVRRLYLPYWPVGLGIGVLYVLLPGVSEAARDWSWFTSLTLYPQGQTALSVAWTLQHEALFYSLFALFYFSGLLWLGLGAWLLAILALPNDSIPFATINLEFLMGVAVAVLYRRGVGHWLLLPASAGFVATWWLIGGTADHSLWIALACSCAILELSLMEQRGQLRIPPLLVFLGGASYALYLVHPVAMSAAARLVPSSWPIILGACILASIAAGIAYYLMIERPLLRWARRWTRST